MSIATAIPAYSTYKEAPKSRFRVPNKVHSTATTIKEKVQSIFSRVKNSLWMRVLLETLFYTSIFIVAYIICIVAFMAIFAIIL